MLILNLKRSPLRNSGRVLINFIFLGGLIIVSTSVACAQPVSLFGSQPVEMKSDESSFDEQNSEILLSGNVEIVSKLEDGGKVEVAGSFVKYNTITEGGKIWGEGTSIKYSVKDSSSSVTMRAKEIHFDKNGENIEANGDVVIVSSSGTVRADEGSFDKKKSSVTFKKGKKKPVVELTYDGRKQTYTADEMIFYDKEDGKKIFMDGYVEGKIDMGDNVIKDNLMEGI